MRPLRLAGEILKIIDSHQHFWKLDRGDYEWLTPELDSLYRDFDADDLKPILAGAGVNGTVTVQAAATEAESRFLLGLAEQHDFIYGVVGWLDMAASGFEEACETLVADGAGYFKGIRPMIQDIDDPDWILSPSLDAAFEFLSDAKLTFDALILPIHIDNLLERLSQHPDLRIVVDHAAKPQIRDGAHDEWRSSIAALARETNAYCKLSGLLTEAAPASGAGDLEPYTDVIFEEFGEDRVMWGSDWPVLNLASTYPEWLDMARKLCASAAPNAVEKVFGGNATKFYNLDLASTRVLT